MDHVKLVERRVNHVELGERDRMDHVEGSKRTANGGLWVKCLSALLAHNDLDKLVCCGCFSTEAPNHKDH